MGWGYLRAIAQDHDVWALVDGWEFGEELRRYQANHLEELKRVHFVFVPCKPHPLLRKLWPPSYYWFYNLWHRRAYRIARKLHAEIHFDAAWKLSMVTYREPGYLWRLPIPFVWGPVGALGYTDWRLLPMLGLRGGFEYLVRNVINWLHSHVKRRPRLAARKANSYEALIAATGENQREMSRLWHVDSVVSSEIGIMNVEDAIEKSNGPLKIVWCGQFTRGKALPLLLWALARVKNHLPIKSTLDVIGDGAMRVRWMRLAERLGLAQMITWHGWVKRAEAIRVQKSSNVSVITSIRDLTSTVLVESLACGNPVICLDHCGFSDVVNETCGIKVPVGWSRDVVDGFAKALVVLSDTARRMALSTGAVRRAREFLWEEKRRTLCRLMANVGSRVGNNS